MVHLQGRLIRLLGPLLLWACGCDPASPASSVVGLCAAGGEGRARLRAGGFWNIAANSTGVYLGSSDRFVWIGRDEAGRVERPSDRFNIAGVATDETGGYFTSIGYQGNSGQLTWLPPAGQLHVLLDGLINPAGVAVDDAHVYFVDSGIPDTSETNDRIWRVGKRGGAAELFQEDSVGWGRLESDATYLYFADGRLNRANKASGEREVLGMANDRVSDFALDGDVIYWVSRTSIWKTTIATREITLVSVGVGVRFGDPFYPSIRVNRDWVFFSARGLGNASLTSIYRMRKAGGVMEEVVSGAGTGSSFAVTDDALYFSTPSAGAPTDTQRLCLSP